MNDVIEGEIVNEGSSLAVRPASSAAAVWVPSFAETVDAMVAKVEAKHDFFRRVMKKGQHYGPIPGTKAKDGEPEKQVLFKAGAELLLTSMGLFVELADAEPPTYRYGSETEEGEITHRRRCRVYKQTGPLEHERMLVAQAEGSCTSLEVKYRWRESKRVCPSCGLPSIIKGKAEYGGGWICFKKQGGCGAKYEERDPDILSQTVGRKPNPDLADVANTILKMADKRALVAATLIATGCSDIFTQDIEAEETSDSAPPPRSEPPPRPGPTPREQAHLDAIEAVLAACRQVNVKAPARGVLDGKSVVELLAYRDRVLAARNRPESPAGGPPASQPTQESPQPAASATEPANASEFPGPGGPPMSLKTQRHLFAVLGELGYDTKQGAHHSWVSSLGLGPAADAIESFALLSEAQAAFLARKAVEEREDLKWECPACGTFDKSKHSANCPERDFTA